MTQKVLNDQIVEVMFSLSRVLREEMNFDSETSQLTVMQLQTLLFIKRYEHVSMSDIATEFNTTLPSATSLLEKMVHLSLVKRTQSPTDRRVVQISLTEKGENVLKEAKRQRDHKISTMLSYLSSDDKEKLLSILQNLSGAIKTKS